MIARGRRGSFTLEYIIFMAIVIMALVGVGRTFKGQLMGRWKTIADSYGHSRQYEKGKTVVSP